MITLKAYAKLNLSLDVTGKRDDGYHDLDMIMQSISLFDTVTVSKANHPSDASVGGNISNEIRVRMDTGNVNETNNTAYTAALLFLELTGFPSANITIQKRIPQMAGLGGSSADAAAVLIGLNQLYGAGLDDQTLITLGKQVGADVPFSLYGGTARAKGIGEKLQQLQLKTPLYFTLVKPYQGVSTAKAFKRYRRGVDIRIDTVAYALQKGDIALYHAHAGNALGIAALSIAPDIMNAANALMTAGAQPLMSGSGSTMFAVFETLDAAKHAADRIQGDFELVGAFSAMATGVEIVGGNDEHI